MTRPLLRPLRRAFGGGVIHLADCTNCGDADEWNFHRGRDDDELRTVIDTARYLRWCGHCRNRHPDILPSGEDEWEFAPFGPFGGAQ